MCVCVSGVHRGQKKVLDRLKLKLQMVMSYNSGAGNWTFLQEEKALLFTTDLAKGSLELMFNWDRCYVIHIIICYGSGSRLASTY